MFIFCYLSNTESINLSASNSNNCTLHEPVNTLINIIKKATTAIPAIDLYLQTSMHHVVINFERTCVSITFLLKVSRMVYYI